MRGVEDIRPLATQHPRHVNLFTDRVVRRRFEDRPEVRAELRGYAEVRLVAEEDVLAVAINPREMPQQVARIGADAEVVEFSCIDRDTHPGIIHSRLAFHAWRAMPDMQVERVHWREEPGSIGMSGSRRRNCRHARKKGTHRG